MEITNQSVYNNYFYAVEKWHCLIQDVTHRTKGEASPKNVESNRELEMQWWCCLKNNLLGAKNKRFFLTDLSGGLILCLTFKNVTAVV